MAVLEIRIREAEAKDLGTLVELSSGLFWEDAGTRDSLTNVDWPKQEGRGYFAGLLEGERSLCLVADISGGTVGYLVGYVKEPTTLRPVRVADLESMYVREGVRGRGVGALLVGEFLARARAWGAGRASVTAYAANERAIRFYEEAGFRARNISLEATI